eukprot:gene9129-10102_t
MEDNLSDDSCEDDPVTHEIDVYLAKALAERLYLFQYPVRPSCLSYDEIPHSAARIKPKQQKVELELELDTASSRYCLPRGEQIAYAVDEAASASSLEKGPYYQSGCMDKQVLTSVRAADKPSRYVAGVFKNGTLSLTPIHGFVQLRPSFEYLDRADDNKQTTSSARMEEEREEKGEPEAKPVMTRFARVKSEESKKQSYQSIEQKLGEEPWTELSYFPATSRTAITEKMLLQCHQEDFESPEFTATSREYLDALAPKHEGKERHPAALPEGVLSMASLKKLDIADQIKALLINAKVIHHHHLISLLGPSLDEKTILKGLHNYAILVQGCWVVKSEIIYPKGSTLKASGTDAEIIWPARDYVLWRFNHKRMLERKDIISVIRIPSEELRDMLEQVARQKPPHGWEFRLPTDSDFLHKHPEVIKSQLQVWKSKITCLKQSLNLTKEHQIKDDETLPGLDASLHSKTRISKPRTKSRDSTDTKRKRGSGTEDEKSPSKVGYSSADNRNKIDSKTTLMGLEMTNSNSEGVEQVKVKKEILDCVKTEPMEGITNGEVIEESGIEMIIDSDQEIKTTTDNDNNSETNKDAFIPPFIPETSSTFFQKPPSNIFIQELDKFIIETLKGGCLSIAEIKEILALRQQEPGNILCSGVSDELLEKRILKVGASKLDVKWPENASITEAQKKVFAFRKTGDQRDNYRQVVLDLFTETFGLKKSEIIAALNEKCGSALSNHLFPRFMGEFCEKYGSNWYLKSTYKAVNPNR